MSGTDTLKTIFFANQAVGILPEAGGAIAYYRTEKPGFSFDWLRPASAESIAAANALETANFPLVPFSNRIKHSRFTFAGKDIVMAPNMDGVPHVIHGHGYRRCWDVESHDKNEIVLSFSHKADSWPWSYTARQIFTLDETGLSITLEVINTSGEIMPVGLGHHFYFNRTPNAIVRAKTELMWKTDADVLPTERIEPKPEHDPNRGIMPAHTVLDNAFAGWDGKADIEWPEHNTGITLTGDSEMGFLVIYTPAGEPFFCVEPVSHETDAFNAANTGRTDTGMMTVKPDAKKAVRVRLRPRQGQTA